MTQVNVVRRFLMAPVIACVVIVLSLAVGSVARSYWSGSGSGSGVGDVSTGETLALTLAPGTPAADLYPGGHSAVVLTMSNPNIFDAHVDSLELDTSQGNGGYDVDADHSECLDESFVFASPQTNGGAGWTVPAHNGTVDGTLATTLEASLTMSLDAANVCQGARVTVYLSALS